MGKSSLNVVGLPSRIRRAANGQTAGGEYVDFDFALRRRGKSELERAAIGIVPRGLAVVLVDEAFGDLHGRHRATVRGRRCADRFWLRPGISWIRKTGNARRRTSAKPGGSDHVVLHAGVDGLEQQRAAADTGLDFLREGELALRVGLDAAEILRTLLGGLEEGDGGARLGLAGGAVDDGAIDGGVGERGEAEQRRSRV